MFLALVRTLASQALILVWEHLAVAVRGAAITLAVIMLAVIKTFLIKWRLLRKKKLTIWPTGMLPFVRVKPQS